MKLLLLAALVGIATASDDDQAVNKEFLIGYNKFTSNVYKELSNTYTGNFVVSTLSADTVLSLVEHGSKGETSKELIKGLHLPKNKEKLREAISALTPKLNVNDLYTLTSANKIYIKEGYKLKQDFKKFAVDIYNSEIENIDFEKGESAAENINKWVEDKTSNNIKNLISKDDLNEYTRALLLNALYFRGTWETQFEVEDTKEDIFYLDSNTKTKVDFMQVSSDFQYHENRKLNAKCLKLPYTGGDISLTIVLPNNKDGIKDLENNIDDIVDATRYRFETVNVKLPKFKIETKVDFNPILEKLGIVKAFGDNAEFPNITDERLKISKVVQKALIEVDEQGTTAAAASAVIMENVRVAPIPREPKDFIADRPFIFILKLDKVVLFIGHYTGK